MSVLACICCRRGVIGRVDLSALACVEAGELDCRRLSPCCSRSCDDMFAACVTRWTLNVDAVCRRTASRDWLQKPKWAKPLEAGWKLGRPACAKVTEDRHGNP